MRAEGAGGSSAPLYPFPAVVGQERAKVALILNAIDPTIGGVLVAGPKGSGKSLLVRALSELLPGVEHVAGCPFRCSPRDPTNMCPSCRARSEAGEELQASREAMRIVQVPLSVTDDMLLGSLDLGEAMEKGVRALRPGLLAEANQGILYIDEVNLLPDRITDVILDAAASGWNIVEREGISVQHPSRFILVGTMNPEEGELRPQLLDRFGLYAETESVADPAQRALLIRRSEEFSAEPESFRERYREEVGQLRTRIETARELLPEVETPPQLYSKVAGACSKLRVDGFRPDIVAMRAVRALAAFHGRRTALPEDLTIPLELALGHRTRRAGLAPPPSPPQIREALRRAGGRGLSLGRLTTLPLRGFVPVSKELLGLIRGRALRALAASLALAAMLSVSVAYLVENLRSEMTSLPPTPPVLLAEVLFGVVVTVLVTMLASRRVRRREEASGVLDLSRIAIETESRLPPTAGASGTGAAAGAARVSYGKGFATTPGYGLKILRAIESLRAGPSAVGPGRTRGPLRRLGGGLRRRKAVPSSLRGRAAWHQIPRGRPRNIALTPTLRAAALRQLEVGGGQGRLVIGPQDVRAKVLEYRPPYSIILLVDMSMSMVDSVATLIEAIYGLYGGVYRRRDRLGLVVFKGARAFTVQHPTTNVDLVVRRLRGVGASDFTPMAAGLLQAWRILKQERLRNPDAVPNLLVFTDGIVNVPLARPISPLSRRRYMSEAQADALDVARIIAKERFRVHVINTNHSHQDAEAMPAAEAGWRLSLRPTQFLMELARVSRGGYHGLSLAREGSGAASRR